MDTPDVTNEPLWTLAVMASEALVMAVKAGDFDAADAVAVDVAGRFGNPGLFALCVGVIAGTWPPGRIAELSFAQLGDDGTVIPSDTDEVPYVVRFVGRFMAAVTSTDVETAWAHWLTIPDNRTKSMIIANLAMISAEIESHRS